MQMLKHKRVNTMEIKIFFKHLLKTHKVKETTILLVLWNLIEPAYICIYSLCLPFCMYNLTLFVNALLNVGSGAIVCCLH